MKRTFYGIPEIFLCLAIFFSALGAGAAETCEQWARIEPEAGVVEVKRKDSSKWVPAVRNEILCPGDAVRTGKNSRTYIRFYNETSARFDQNTLILITGKRPEEGLLLKLKRGVAYFFSRRPRNLDVETPFVTAKVEGTEFLVKTNERESLITVYTGRIRAENEYGGLILNNGESARAVEGRAPERLLIVRPRDAVHWALYYPPVFDFEAGDFPETLRQAVRQSVGAEKTGGPPLALEILDRVPENIRDARFYAHRAGLFLSAGRVAEAKADIEKTGRTDPALAMSLQSIIATVTNKKDEALELAKEAVKLDPDSTPARVALGYAQQAAFDLEGALASQQKAAELDPENALAWARLAELRLAFGDLDAAGDAARKAASLNPELARTQTVLGYSHLTRIEIKEAAEAFEKAIRLDQSDPLPRLGLGLANIRNGDLKKGRADIEAAAILDPNNSLIRSYLGKAFYEEKRDKLAEKQFEIAKTLDPNDPTPWLYGAIQKQAGNRPVEALLDIRKSIELNDNRAVYRSRLLLDRDTATRSASLARIYDDLGFQQLALVEGWKSLNTDPGNYSAHRFLAESYSALPRHEIARVSELLQAQLLQPVNGNPVQPHIAETNSYIQKDVLQSGAAFNEYSPLFERNRLAFKMDQMVGNNATFSEGIVQSGLLDRYSYILGQFHYETDGFRENNDHDKNIYNAFVQTAVSHKTSIQAEYRYNDTERGDLALRFDPDNYSDKLRTDELVRTVRIGFMHEFPAHSKILCNGVYQDEQADGYEEGVEYVLDENGFRLELDKSMNVSFEIEGYMNEIQHIYSKNNCSVISGIGYFKSKRNSFSNGTLTISHPMIGTLSEQSVEENQTAETDYANLYIYSHIPYPKDVVLNVGFSANLSDSDSKEKELISPILGFTYNLFHGIHIRGAVFGTLQRPILSFQTIQPTQVAGFNQLYHDYEGTESWNYGLALDQKISDRIYWGTEYRLRMGDTSINMISGTSNTENYEWDESMVRAYLYWAPVSFLALSAEYFFERQKTDQIVPDPVYYRDIKTHKAPIGISCFHKSGFTLKTEATYVDQEYGYFDSMRNGEKERDGFLLIDAGISYRLPEKLGILTIEVKNIFDEKFQFQDTDAANPRLHPYRQVFGKINFSF